MKGFKQYNKTELMSQINQIQITKEGDQVITKLGNRVINTTPVSKRYEAFDIAKYLREKIELIEQNFTITAYKFILKRGVQSLQLLSDKITIGGLEFYKSFYILNSSDKSRRLSFNLGLFCEQKNFYIVGVKNVGLNKLHLTGVTQAAEEASSGINHETFSEQISSIGSLVGHQIAFSKLREVILGDKETIPGINHRKFDAFKNSVRFLNSDGLIKLNQAQLNMLFKESEKMTSIDQSEDFVMDAFLAFRIYLTIFNRQDSHIIKTETERIMKMTKWAIRNSALEALGI
jgi:hypothetical protein